MGVGCITSDYPCLFNGNLRGVDARELRFSLVKSRTRLLKFLFWRFLPKILIVLMQLLIKTIELFLKTLH